MQISDVANEFVFSKELFISLKKENPYDYYDIEEKVSFSKNVRNQEKELLAQFIKENNLEQTAHGEQ